MSNKLMKLSVMLLVMTIVVAIAGYANAKVVQQAKTTAENKNLGEIVKKGTEVPNVTLFYIGELAGRLTPCG